MVRAKYLLGENMFLFCMSVWHILHQPGCSFNICCGFSIGERINAAIFCCVKKKKKAFSHSSSLRKASAHQGRALSLYQKNTVQYVCSKLTNRSFGLTADTVKINFVHAGDVHIAAYTGFCGSPWKGVVGAPPAKILGWIPVCHSALP